MNFSPFWTLSAAHASTSFSPDQPVTPMMKVIHHRTGVTFHRQRWKHTEEMKDRKLIRYPWRMDGLRSLSRLPPRHFLTADLLLHCPLLFYVPLLKAIRSPPPSSLLFLVPSFSSWPFSEVPSFSQCQHVSYLLTDGSIKYKFDVCHQIWKLSEQYSNKNTIVFKGKNV